MVYPLYRTNHKDLAKWIALRTYGKKKVIIIYGYLSWGISVVLLWSFLSLFGFYKDLFFFLLALLTFPICGYLCGVIYWTYNERKILRWEKNASEAEIQAVIDFSEEFDPDRRTKVLFIGCICIIIFLVYRTLVYRSILA